LVPFVKGAIRALVDAFSRALKEFRQTETFQAMDTTVARLDRRPARHFQERSPNRIR
jgi:hypothetical protein